MWRILKDRAGQTEPLSLSPRSHRKLHSYFICRNLMAFIDHFIMNLCGFFISKMNKKFSSGKNWRLRTVVSNKIDDKNFGKTDTC